jgi:hypothetical protein
MSNKAARKPAPPLPPKRSETTKLSQTSLVAAAPAVAARQPTAPPPVVGLKPTTPRPIVSDEPNFQSELQRAMQKRLQKINDAE